MLIPYLTVLENLVLPYSITKAFDVHVLKERATNLLSELNLEDKKHRFPKQMSTGERKRADITRALVHDPNILLLDEHISHLDEGNIAVVVDLLKEMNKRGKTVVLITSVKGRLVSIVDDVLQLPIKTVM